MRCTRAGVRESGCVLQGSALNEGGSASLLEPGPRSDRGRCLGCARIRVDAWAAHLPLSPARRGLEFWRQGKGREGPRCRCSVIPHQPRAVGSPCHCAGASVQPALGLVGGCDAELLGHGTGHKLIPLLPRHAGGGSVCSLLSGSLSIPWARPAGSAVGGRHACAQCQAGQAGGRARAPQEPSGAECGGSVSLVPRHLPVAQQRGSGTAWGT